MSVPIVLTAFGTTTKARDTYALMAARIQSQFPGQSICWSMTSRMVKDRLHQTAATRVSSPVEVLMGLHQAGHAWAVVQSLHVMCGHEFYRLRDDLRDLPIRTSLGLPLLHCPEDYRRLALEMGRSLRRRNDEAVVLVGHGTDHPGWTVYPALEAVFREMHGPGYYVGAIDGYPSREQVLSRLQQAGYRQIRLVPLLLVAGVHVLKDLDRDEDSWRNFFVAAGYSVTIEPQGIGANPIVMDMFIQHIQEALAVIPDVCPTWGCSFPARPQEQTPCWIS